MKVLKKRRKVSYKDVKQIYTSERSRYNLENYPFGHVICRPISMRLAPFFINMGFSATAVVILRFLILICGLVFVLLGAVKHYNFVIGAALVFITQLLDNVDGDIARTLHQSTKFGELLDGIIDVFCCAFLTICLGMGLFFGNIERSVLALGIEIPKWSWLLAAIIKTCTALSSHIIVQHAQILVGTRDLVRSRQIRSTVGFVSIKVIFSSDFEVFMFLVAALFGTLSLFLLVYTVFYIIAFLAVIILALRKVALADREKTQ